MSSPGSGKINKGNHKKKTSQLDRLRDVETLRDRLGHNIEAQEPSQLFNLKERLGKGSFGSVFKAVNNVTSEIVAVKIISLADEQALDDVRREISILKECDNSHIVKYYGSYFEDDNLWVCSPKPTQS